MVKGKKQDMNQKILKGLLIHTQEWSMKGNEGRKKKHEGPGVVA